MQTTCGLALYQREVSPHGGLAGGGGHSTATLWKWNLPPFNEASYFEASERVADDRCAGWWARVMWLQLHSAASEL